jgi:hypothetical protein
VRGIITFVLGLYLTVALVVAGCGAWHFMVDSKQLTDNPPPLARTAAGDTQLAGEPNWIPCVLYRGVAWPKAYLDDASNANDIADWLMVKGYNVFAGSCRWLVKG